MNTADRILINMAIQNTPYFIGEEQNFIDNVKKRYKIYKKIHEELE